MHIRAPTPDEHPMLTSDAQLHLELVQHHLQTLPGTTQSHSIKSGAAAYISREVSWLQAFTSTTIYILVDEHMPMAWLHNYPTTS
jgi:hypothetical protein